MTQCNTVYQYVFKGAGEVSTKNIGSVYRSVYCIYMCILPCYTTLSSNNTSRLYTLLPHLYFGLYVNQTDGTRYKVQVGTVGSYSYRQYLLLLGVMIRTLLALSDLTLVRSFRARALFSVRGGGLRWMPCPPKVCCLWELKGRG